VIQDSGILRSNGIEAQILFIAGGPTTIAALISGEMQFAVFAGPAAVTANIGGALMETNWVVHGNRGAASILGINPSTLRSRIQKLGIKKESRAH
jgi:ABC-type nitrate/sulfonate/bicarbonate transport system substrate-binding protein